MLTESVQNKKIWKDRAHEYFDVIWEHRKYSTRNELYGYLKLFLNRNPHISSMGPEACKRVIKWSIDLLNDCTNIERKYGINVHSKINYPVYLLV